ncbi:flagellar protein FlaG [Mariprofundus ferrinatatus]|uniref:Flagellar protein FlaG n=1 Tax=Mariprofundus ferrinatatus TaxID=1921087 RepID=A0A2K8L6V2_9PROT|nr:flagellar protein FlaG [Mariprofundus ferrinatatus]ATX82963.1 flagellar protein FlaG [Mariprofundus ferrinatatus]
MSAININNIASSTATSSAIGTAAQQKPLVVSNSKDLDKTVQKQDAPVDSEAVKEAVAQANARLTAASSERLSFGYEERLNRLYVQIKDNATGEVVREIPPKKLIEQQAAMSEMIGMILDKSV